MLINFLGDSITYGVGAENDADKYVSLVERRLGVSVNNYGISGTRIARQSPPCNEPHDADFLMRAPDMDKNADFVFIFGGTNDYGHGDAKIGEISDKTPYTFYGAMNLLTELLVKEYGKEKLCFILPLHRAEEDNEYGAHGMKPERGGKLSEYVEAMLYVLRREKIEYLDLRGEFAPELIPQLTTDGLHPNNAGHAIIANAVISYLNNKFNI